MAMVAPPVADRYLRGHGRVMVLLLAAVGLADLAQFSVWIPTAAQLGRTFPAAVGQVAAVSSLFGLAYAVAVLLVGPWLTATAAAACCCGACSPSPPRRWRPRPAQPGQCTSPPGPRRAWSPSPSRWPGSAGSPPPCRRASARWRWPS